MITSNGLRQNRHGAGVRLSWSGPILAARGRDSPAIMSDPLLVLTFSTALGCGLIGGVFFAFSTFVMPALARVRAPEGIAAMQSINVAAITPLFMFALFCTGAACVFLSGYALFTWQTSGAAYLFTGGALYFAGVVVVTIVCNVPRNNALAGVNPTSADGAQLWADYLTTWTAWNHVRTLTALAAASLLTTAWGLQYTSISQRGL